MDVLIDTNIIMDYITKRVSSPNLDASIRAIEMCTESDIHGYVAFHSISNLWFSLRTMPQNIRRQWLIYICEILTVIGTEHDKVIRALHNREFKDFEDCLQDECAIHANVDYIITWNIADYKLSHVPAITPLQWIDLYKEVLNK